MRYRVVAFNTATASANKIHDDAVASRLGFRGGLVPGVDVYAYLCHLPAERWGGRWVEGGTLTARFEHPVYDGDEVEITADPLPDGDGDGDGVELSLTDPAGTRCAVATAALAEPPSAVDADRWPSGAPPEHPPLASPTTLDVPFGSIRATFRAERAGEYLDDVREELALFRDGGPAHPGWLLRQCNFVLTANVTMGPWIHVGSTAHLLGAVTDGDVVETRALVTDVRERGGHHFVELDVLQLAGERPVARTAHTAIYQPRGT